MLSLPDEILAIVLKFAAYERHPGKSSSIAHRRRQEVRKAVARMPTFSAYSSDHAHSVEPRFQHDAGRDGRDLL